MFRETHVRSVMKALSWRVTGTIATTVLVYAFTRRFVLSLAVGGIEFVAKVGLYWLHERAWDRVAFGRNDGRTADTPGSSSRQVSDAVPTRLRKV